MTQEESDLTSAFLFSLRFVCKAQSPNPISYLKEWSTVDIFKKGSLGRDYFRQSGLRGGWVRSLRKEKMPVNVSGVA